jgi:hypothetical protein
VSASLGDDFPLTHQGSLLDQLRSLKRVPVEQLTAGVRALASENADIYDDIDDLVAADSASILRTTLSEDKDKVVLGVLLAAVADDIGTVPAELRRRRSLRRLNEACRLLGVNHEDVYCLLEFMPALRPFLDRRPGWLPGDA